MINHQHKSDAEYIAEMKNAWGTQLDPYILTIRSLENKFESLCAQLDKLDEQQKVLVMLKSEHKRVLEDRQFWFEECDRIKAKLNAKHQQQRNALEEALKENARLKAQLHKKDREIRLVKVERDREKSSRELYYTLYEFLRKEAVALKARPTKTLSIQQLIEGHAESIRLSVEGFPYWVQELMVKEQLGFFEPILEGPQDCPKTS